MITLKLRSEYTKAPDPLKELPGVVSIPYNSGNTPPSPPPSTQEILKFAVFKVEGQKVAADYFTSREGEWPYDTIIRLALEKPLGAEKGEGLRLLLENTLNSLTKEEFSYFVEIVDEACRLLKEEFKESGVIGHSSYVPD